MFFLTNPKHKRRRRASARRSTRRRSRRAASKRRRAMPAALRAYWASKRKGRTVARRRKHRRGRRRAAVARNPVVRRRRRRHSYRRNPAMGGFGRGNIVRTVTEGLKSGAAILAGEGISTTVAGFVPVLGNTGIVGALKVGIIGTVIGGFGRRFLGSYTREFVGAAWAKAIKTAVPVASIPLIGPGLAGYTPLLAAPSRMSGYAPRSSGSGMSAADDGSGYSF